jgi:nitroreductase
MTQTLSRALTVSEAITTRRSIRAFVQEPLDQNDLREILRLASLAPSAWNAQTWRFAVVQDPALKEGSATPPTARRRSEARPQ